MPYAFGIDKNGRPDAEARARLDKAYASAKEKIERFDVIIFLGAGMSEYTQRYGVASLAMASSLYLQEWGWPEDRIVMRPIGYSTMTETRALRDYLAGCKCFPDQVQVEVASSWWHAPRVSATCMVFFGSSVRIVQSSTEHTGKKLIIDIMREILALPRSVLMAWYARKKNKSADQISS